MEALNLLRSLLRRWRYVRAAVRQAGWVAETHSAREDLVAAELHDIGYVPSLVETGLLQ